MENKLEDLIKLAYRKWKKDSPRAQENHPDEETLACFVENKLSEEENESVCAHLIACYSCLEAIVAQAGLKASEIEELPEGLIERVKGLEGSIDKSFILEIILKAKEKLLEMLETNGDILVGQELMPASILRSRQIKEFKDKVTILKDFQSVRIEVSIESKQSRSVNLTVIAKEKQTNKLIRDLRITLIKDDIELESYLSDSGSVTFEQVILGKYSIEIVASQDKLATVKLDIKK